MSDSRGRRRSRRWLQLLDDISTLRTCKNSYRRVRVAFQGEIVSSALHYLILPYVAEHESDLGAYRMDVNLQGMTKTRHFVDRPAEMEAIEKSFFTSQKQVQRQKIHILRGMGGIGKTQLAVEFARRHHRRFSAVLWLEGNSEDTIK